MSDDQATNVNNAAAETENAASNPTNPPQKRIQIERSSPPTDAVSVTFHSTDAGEGGKEGSPGQASPEGVSNADFVAALFPSFEPGVTAAICSKPGNPDTGGWQPQPTSQVEALCPADANNYLNCSSFSVAEDGSLTVRKEAFAALHVIVLDDVGTKVDRELLATFKPTWEIETSPGNAQVGILLREPVDDLGLAERLLAAIVAKGLNDPGASGVSRWSRLPVAINGKPKHAGASGKPFECRLTTWNPTVSYGPNELVDRLSLTLGCATPDALPGRTLSTQPNEQGDDVYTPAPLVNPVITALKDQGFYKREIGPGKHDITCPWAHEHTDELDSGTAYFEPTAQYATGGFCCQHSHRDEYHIGKLLDRLDVTIADARGRARIRLIAGEINLVNAAAEKVLARRGNHYASGGIIVSIAEDRDTHDLALVPASDQAITKELAAAADWERFDKASGGWIRCDPPTRNVTMLWKAQSYEHLPLLAGFARQPFFRESDGELVCTSGYDPKSQRYAAFDPGEYTFPNPTEEEARTALVELRKLLSEFRFASEADESAALSAIFTATVRPSLPVAPAFHVRAPTMASGKSYLCGLIGAFASPGPSLKVSYPTTSEEATKVVQSLLLPGPAVIEFDDMATDWIPHGVINRMLTSTTITDRVLGVSKVATVSTRTLFLGSGNNVGPIRDLQRRVATIHLDTRTETPAFLTYDGKPAESVRANRGRYVSSVLTIIAAWQRAGMPRAPVVNIASYGNHWAEYCRHPLIWLGLPDPAASLLDQVRSEPDSEGLGAFMMEWHNHFGNAPTTLRTALKYGNSPYGEAFHDALEELPVFDRDGINKGKLGWYLRKNVNRIVGGLEFRPAKSSERNAWSVHRVDQPSPPLPPLIGRPVNDGTASEGGDSKPK